MPAPGSGGEGGVAESTRAAARRPAEDTTGAVGARMGTPVRLAAGAVLAAAAALWLAFLWHALRSPVGQYDFSSFYAAALALRHDPHADIYAAAVLARSGAAAHVQVQPPLPYTYPPLLAMLFTPLTLVPFRVAARLWLLANAGLWLAATAILAVELRVWLRRAPIARDDAGRAPATSRAGGIDDLTLVALAASAAVCLPFAPAQQTVLTGQIDLLVLLPLALIPALTRGGHERWAGGAVALAAMLKLTPVILVGYLLLRRRWEAALAAVAALATLALASLAVVGPRVFFAAFPEALRVGGHDTGLGQNEALFAPLVGAIAAAGPGAAAAARDAEYALLLALAVAIGVVLWRARPGPSAETPTYAVGLSALLLLAPTAWVHHYVWVLPAAVPLLGVTAALALGAAEPEWRGRGRLLLGVTMAAAALLLPGLPYQWDTQAHPATTLLLGLPLRPLALELRAVGTVLMLGVGAALALRMPGFAAREGPHP
jgi:alpha-1,2-mannosyltransferase